MTEFINKLFKRQTNEDGFTLIEIAITVLILGILAGISVPLFFKYQAELNSQAMKANLQSAAILIEQEQIDNNGLYPKYIPNEVLDDKDSTNDYAYTFSKDRTKFCLQANTPSGKWFVSSENKTVTQNICTQSEVAQNGTTPWKRPVVPVPSVNTATNIWPATSSNSISSVKINPVVCQLSSEDNDEWGGAISVTYQVTIKNTTRGDSIFSEWNASTQTDIALNNSNWLPGDNLSYTVKARCTINSGSGYTYDSADSAAKTGTIAAFTVNPVAFKGTPNLTWSPEDNVFSYNAEWNDGFCPAGVKQYVVDVSQASVKKETTGNTTWALSVSKPGPSLEGGLSTQISHKVACKLSNGTTVYSSATTTTLTSPLVPPAPPANFRADNGAGATTVLPNRFAWDAVTCVKGTPQYQIRRTLPGPTGLGGWVTNLASEKTLVAGTTYTWDVQARCVSGSITSAASAWADSITFTARYTAPSTPGVVETLRSDNNGVSQIKNDRLIWDVAVCDMGATPYYSVRKVTHNGAAITPTDGSDWQTGGFYNIPENMLVAGSSLGFQVQSKCVNSSGDSVPTAWSATHTFTTSVKTPPAPAGLSNNGWGKVSWAAVTTCEPGTTPQYRINRTKLNNTTVNTFTAWTIATTMDLPYNQGMPQGARLQVKCVGTNAESDASGVSNVNEWTTGIDAPSAVPNWQVGIPYGGSPKGESWGAVTCPTGTYAIYYIYSYGDYSNVIAGPVEQANYYGFGRGVYSTGNTMVNSILKARCATAYTTSPWGVEGYRRY